MTDPLARLTAALSDRYTIEREIGAGGMATVYLAKDLKLHRKVALKVLRPDLAAALGPERFLQEIEIAAQLHHPHILPLHDSGEADGFLYYVMPYEEGQSLRERLANEGELPVAEAVRIIREVVDALAHAHENGVVHRDIKPDNVLLSGRHALVTDFGVAKAVSDATGRQKLTTAGVALGTPAYMAPEQAAADPHIDHRADIYAVGAVAYELLTGRPPFTGTTQQEILAAQVTLAAEPVTKFRASVPPALEQLVMKCLEKKAADRWQTAEELLPQLEALATPSGGVTPTGKVPVAATPSMQSRWRIAALAIAATVALFVAFFLGKNVFGGGGAGIIRVAVLPFTTRSADTTDVYLAEGVAEQIGVRLKRLQQLRVSSSAAVTAQLARTPDALETAQALDAEFCVTGTLRRAADAMSALVEIVQSGTGDQIWSSRLTMSDDDWAALEAEVAESVAVALVGAVAPIEAEALRSQRSVDPEAHRLYLVGNVLWNRRTPESVAGAVQHYTDALDLDSNFVEAWAMLGMTRLTQFTWSWDSDVPRDSLPVLARIANSRALALDSSSATAWGTDALLAGFVQNDFSKARSSFDRALLLDSLNAEVYHMYGFVLGSEMLCDLDIAERMLRRALDLEPDRPNTWRHLAIVELYQGNFEAAEALFDTVLAFQEWAPAYMGRSYVRSLMGDAQGAVADAKNVERLYVGQRMDVATARAFAEIVSGDSSLARNVLAQYGELDDVRRAAASIWAARGFLALGLHDEALTVLEEWPRAVRTWAVLHDPIFTPLHDDPRYIRLLEESRPETM
jgi:serine/threonine-protein kinase